MALRDLSKDDLQLIGRCLAAAVGGPFFPDWEFNTLFGLERHEVAYVMKHWPNVDPDDHRVQLAVTGAIGHLLGYPHGEDLGCIATSEEALREALRKWQQ